MVLNPIRTTTPRRPDERGAILVLSALLMAAMLTIAAIAVDLANARQERRQAQATADAAALAGAQDLPDPNKVVTTVKAYVEKSFDVAPSAWNGCTDPDALPNRPDGGNGNQCISIDEAFTRVRVRIPDTPVDTFFAGIIGIGSVDVTADAVAETKLRRDDRIIPATVAASTGSGNECIENGGANQAPCDRSTSGNFGSFNAPRLNLFKPTSQVENNSLRINYSMGVDHVLSIWGTGSPKVCDHDLPVKSPCTTTNLLSGLDANHLLPFTGNVVPPLTDGLVENADISTDDGTRTFCGRLRRPDLTSENLTQTDPEGCNHWAGPTTAGPAITVLGEKVNGRHIAYWMKPAFRAVFYPGVDPATTPATSSAWAAGNAKLKCFLEAYRFDYGGDYSKGYPAQSEFFINPASTIDPNTADGVPFTLAQATTYLRTTCGLPADFVDPKMVSLSDSNRFWPMFEKGMVADSRFGMIPVVKQFNSGSSTPMQIVRFWATFLYRLYSTPTKVQAVDAWVFEPALIETESGLADLQFGYQTNQPVIRLVE